MKKIFNSHNLIAVLFISITFTTILFVGPGICFEIEGSKDERKVNFDVKAISAWLNVLVFGVGEALEKNGQDKAPIPNSTVGVTQTVFPGVPPLGGDVRFYNGYVAGFSQLNVTAENFEIDDNGDGLLNPDICLKKGSLYVLSTFHISSSQGTPMPITGNYKNVCFQPFIRILAQPTPTRTTTLDNFLVKSAGFLDSHTIHGLGLDLSWVERPAMQYLVQQVKTAVEKHLIEVVKVYFAKTMSNLPFPLGAISAIIPISIPGR